MWNTETERYAFFYNFSGWVPSVLWDQLEMSQIGDQMYEIYRTIKCLHTSHRQRSIGRLIVGRKIPSNYFKKFNHDQDKN